MKDSGLALSLAISKGCGAVAPPAERNKHKIAGWPVVFGYGSCREQLVVWLSVRTGSLEMGSLGVYMQF